MLEVEPEQRRLACGERVTVQTGMRGSGQLCLDPIARDDGVETRHTLLRSAVDGRLCLRVADHGQQRHVAQIADARAAEMGVAEADDDVVTDVIARTPVPATRMHRGTELYEPEWHIGTIEDVTMSARTDSGIDILGILPRLSAKRQTEEKSSNKTISMRPSQSQQRQKDYFLEAAKRSANGSPAFTLPRGNVTVTFSP